MPMTELRYLSHSLCALCVIRCTPRRKERGEKKKGRKEGRLTYANDLLSEGGRKEGMEKLERIRYHS